MSILKPAAHSVAGHKGSLADNDNSIFAKKSTPQEVQFYTQLLNHDTKRLEAEDLNDGDLLTDWMPSSFGTLTENKITETELSKLQFEVEQIQVSQQLPPLPTSEDTYLVLSNVLRNFKKPSILDIKLGSILTDEHATEEKKQRLQKVSENTTSGSLSYRVCGMKVYSKHKQVPDTARFSTSDGAPFAFSPDQITVSEHETGTYLVFDKHFGRSLTETTMKDALKLFLGHSVSERVQRHYVEMFWKRLVMIYNCLLDYEVRIVSGSLLFVIENDVDEEKLDDVLVGESDEEEEEEGEEEEDGEGETRETDDIKRNTTQRLSSLNLIDFAHAKLVPGQGRDENILEGIENLKNIFEQILNEQD